MEKESAYVPEYFRTTGSARFGGSYEMWADYVFGSSAASDPVKMKGLLASGNIRAITEDPAWKLYAAVMRLKDWKSSARLN
ncbi:MAG: hypothetical protein QM743_01735 [Chitinophagaceae bacterium]